MVSAHAQSFTFFGLYCSVVLAQESPVDHSAPSVSVHFIPTAFVAANIN